MARFRFRLEMPLKLARVERDRRRRELGELLRELVTVEGALARLEEDERAWAEELVARAREGETGAGLAEAAAMQERLRSRRPVLEARRRELAEREREARSALADVTRQVKVLERLRQEARLRHLREEERREATEVEDLVLGRRRHLELAKMRGEG